MNEELKKMIHQAMAEEQADHDRYKHMAEMADGHCAGVLCDIAHEEESHKHLLEQMLMEE